MAFRAGYASFASLLAMEPDLALARNENLGYPAGVAAGGAPDGHR